MHPWKASLLSFLLLLFVFPFSAEGKTNEYYALSSFSKKSSYGEEALYDLSVNPKSAGVLIAENEPDNILYHQNGQSLFYPSSTTKVMTLYLALKYGDLDEEVVVPEEIQEVPYDSSLAHLKPGEKMTFETLLHGLMLPSGNDAAVAVAHHISGSVSDFVELMNEEAQNLGAENTHFMNPHGYHESSHYSTAYDLSLFMFAALEYEKGEEIMGSHTYSASYVNPDGAERKRTWRTTNDQLLPDSPHASRYVSGGKTGYTSQSLYNLLSFSRVNGDLYVTAALRSGRQNRYQDTTRMVLQVLSKKQEQNYSHRPVSL
jgi:D-alanyl-D-alanine carboxypeptidase